MMATTHNGPAHRLLTALTLALSLAFATEALAGGDWNDAGIAWQSYDEGLAEAAESAKPVCLIFYTDWCPHCAKYSKLFHKEEVALLAKKFVMVRMNRDENKELSGKYAPDGGYIPRTLFLTPQGKLRAWIHEARPEFRYFYNYSTASSLLRSMNKALGPDPEPEP